MTPRDRAAATSAPALARTRQRVLDALRARRRPTAIAELAEQLGIHPNTARFHLDRLIADGRVERLTADPDGPGRPAVLVRVVPGMDTHGTRHYRLLAESLGTALAAAPDGTALAEQAGRELGRRLAADEAAASHRESGVGAAGAADADGDADPINAGDAVDTLRRVLAELDFAPVRTGPDEIELHSCPFLELVGTDGGVACAVHLGLMRGVLDAVGADIAIGALTPFVTPERCVTRLTAA